MKKPENMDDIPKQPDKKNRVKSPGRPGRTRNRKTGKRF